MDSWFNIPAPAVVKGESDVGAEKGDRPIVIVAQADAEASAKVDLLKLVSRKPIKCSHGCPYRKPTQVGE